MILFPFLLSFFALDKKLTSNEDTEKLATAKEL